ncbi:3-hydroxyacyl-CoA dehydrogenase family protein [Streptomyces johnsoniae]|uniref:3-hydroxyacyl-CoA dehydrogenase family protein n=1 Tax=Streptomyces johnsoniae TaxID=3075532 RepID=A0ABU2RX33_9ACTN|nr:3-hydroxyacyl-CoA dehydrogenase family protein [Streptomyces sp. DSM 41886]MDT0441311.1 3-hydroxyacyl-CoA dehydrogenase family protein [Streptomyces sp. DSM 41886]
MARKLAVIGAGLMGSGIAQVAAAAGWDVTLRDVTDAALARARSGIETSLARFVAKDKVSEDEARAALARIATTTDLDAAADADIVVEAVFERLDVKQDLLRTLDGLVGEHTVLASNTSAIPITKLAAATAHPERVIGTHFFSPVPLMALCELVRGHRTSDATLATAREFAESTGKTCIVVERDVAGFVTTRLISALLMEAVRLYESGVATAEDIDAACRLGFGHAMGPLETADLTGVDVLLHAAQNIHTETQDGKFVAPELMRRMVDAGDIGRKSGRGFYRH